MLESTRNQLRLDRLAQRLREHGPLAVRDTVSGAAEHVDRRGARRHGRTGRCRSPIVRRHGDRYAFLDDDSVLRLKLFWPRRQIVAALKSIRCSSRIGWIVTVRPTRSSVLDG